MQRKINNISHIKLKSQQNKNLEAVIYLFTKLQLIILQLKTYWEQNPLIFLTIYPYNLPQFLGLYSMSTQSLCIYVFPGQPVLVYSCGEEHRRHRLQIRPYFPSSTHDVLHVCKIGGRWP